jgi:RNA polymerase sigma factor (sigma-70 family)
MRESTVATREVLGELAERMVRRYVRDLLTVDELVERIDQAWGASICGETPGGPALESLARGLCSQVLCEFCQMSGGRQRELAFERLNEYLVQALYDVGGMIRSAAREVREEVIQQTLVEILQSLQRERGRPEQPMAFLGWARVILRRQLTSYWRQKAPMDLLSLDEQEGSMCVELIDERAPDPLAVMQRCELRAELRVAITNLRNSNYREVLLKIYFGELEASEVADLLNVPVADIYLWHHRALQALRKQAVGRCKPCQTRGPVFFLRDNE